MTNEYFKSFIIGSSFPVFAIYFYSVAHYSDKEINYSYKDYTLLAPVFLGLLNMFGLYISQKYNLNRWQRFFFTGLFGAIFVSLFITLFKAYNFDNQERWFEQYVGLFVVYIFVFCVIVNLVDYLI